MASWFARISSGASSPQNPLKTWNDNFVEYVVGVQKTGTDIDGNPSGYVGYDDLSRYWEGEERLLDVLDSNQTAPISAEQYRIRQSYLRIWSCLVYIGHPEFIVWFIEHLIEDDHVSSDHDLINPLANEDVVAQGIIREFHQEHWKFWPLIFEKDKRMFKHDLDSRCVLPITFQDRLTPAAGYDRAVVSKVCIDESCCDFEEKTVVFKVFQHYHEDDAAFDREVSLFEKLTSTDSSNVIVQCLGSFKQNQKCVVVLELAPGGSLESFLGNTRKPRTRQELHQLWDNMINLLNALFHLHNLTPGLRTVGCAHGEIKLGNILVFPKSADEVYDFDLKLTDFEKGTNLQVLSSDSDDKESHNGAPEASRIGATNENEISTVPLKSDIWSLGAVFSEVIVWLADGIKGVWDFERRRKQETSNLPGFRGGGFEACFHDGVKRLNCVDEVLEESLDRLLKLDNITPLIKRLTVDYMLVQVDIRLDAKPLHQFFLNEVAKITLPAPPRLQVTRSDSVHTITLGRRPSEDGVATNILGTATGSVSRGISSTQEEDDMAVNQDSESQYANTTSFNLDTKGPWLPRISVPEVNSWLDTGAHAKLSRMGLVLQELKGRDQLFVIDDSSSMRQHSDHLWQTSRALMAMASEVDRVQMVFTSNPTKFIRDKRPWMGGGLKNMVAKIRSHREQSDTVIFTDMEASLGKIFEKIGRKRLNPTSIYIMTDGVWKPSDSLGGGVEEPIKVLVRHLIRNSLERIYVTLQFIQFGHDPVGTDRLRYLDNDLPRMEAMKYYDIVDLRRHEDDVPHMLIGAVARDYDQEDAPIDLGHGESSVPPSPKPLARKRNRKSVSQATADVEGSSHVSGRQTIRVGPARAVPGPSKQNSIIDIDQKSVITDNGQGSSDTSDSHRDSVSKTATDSQGFSYNPSRHEIRFGHIPYGRSQEAKPKEENQESLSQAGAGIQYPPLNGEIDQNHDKLFGREPSSINELMERFLIKWQLEEKPAISDVRNLQNIISELAYSQPTWIKIVEQAPSLADQLKCVIEYSTGEAWDWWPLSPRTMPLGEHQVHILWTCKCGRERTGTMPRTLAEELQGIFSQGLQDLDGSGVPAVGPTAPEQVHLARQAVDARGSSTTDTTRNTGNGEPNRRRGIRYRGRNSFRNELPSSRERRLVIYFMVDNSSIFPWKRGLGKSKILSTSICDNEFYDTMRTEYWGHRGWWRKWLSLYTFQGCDFYQFKCYRFNRYRETQEGIPGEPEGYNYTVEELPPQISWEEFRDGFWYGCDSISETAAVERIPKKEVSTNFKKELPAFWGIVAREQKSFLMVLIYVCLSLAPLIPSAWFFFLWLTPAPEMDEFQKANHRDNLSNAFVPLGISVALFMAVLTCVK